MHVTRGNQSGGEEYHAQQRKGLHATAIEESHPRDFQVYFRYLLICFGILPSNAIELLFDQ